MSVNEWTNLLAAVGTITATGVAAFSANLAWRQVRLQFQPRLLILNARFQIGVFEGALEEFWWREPSEAARYLNGGETEFSLRLANIGNGPAHDIRVAVSFDFEAVYADVIGKLEKYAPHITFEHDNFGFRALSKGKPIGGFRLPDQSFGIIEYLESANTTRRIERLAIDPNLAFFALCYAYYLMRGNLHDKDSHLAQTVPFFFAVGYVNSEGKRISERTPYTMSITGGKFMSDFTDGVAFVSFSRNDD